ncbi:radical SAM protein [Sinorhizobium arboris]|uniref:radical SAM protein n=1 Tax=Sinorhizobium arboris TaxID=76745 RepID=UPI00048053FF|nr:radical SAM protein [Sinorhizobium arboris]
MKTRYGYAGIHGFDRQTGLNILLDEVHVDPSQWSLAPRYMSFALTNACELACPYCYASKIPARQRFEDILRWAKDLDAAGCFGVGFGGGEPTLYPRFAELCRDVALETNLAVTMTTHGHRFSDELSDKLSGHVNFIRLSMDGVGETYERLRGRSFPSFLEKLALVRSTARFGVNFVVNDETIEDLPEAAALVFGEGAEEFLLLPQTGTDGKLAMAPETLRRLKNWVSDNYERCRLATSAHGGEEIDAPMLMTSKPEYQTYDFMHVDATGTLKISAFAGEGISLTVGTSIVAAIQETRSKQSQMEEYA